MEKITYKNWANINISVDLKNGYSIVAMGDYKKNRHGYDIKFWIKDNDVDRLDCAEELSLFIKSDVQEYKMVKKKILDNIIKLHKNSDFEEYIKRTEYEFNCLYLGIECLNANED